MSRAAWYDPIRDVIVVDRAGELVELPGTALVEAGLALERLVLDQVCDVDAVVQEDGGEGVEGAAGGDEGAVVADGPA